MKIVLVVLNILLAGLVVWSGLNFFKDLAPGSKATMFTVKKRDPNTRPTVTESKVAAPEKPSTEIAGDEQVKQIVEQDIFNQDRCPNAGVWGGGNARLEMTLVGTFVIGKTKGAVILQRTQNRTTFMPFGGMMMNQGGPGGMMNQRRQGIGRGGMGGPGGGMGGPGGMGQGQRMFGGGGGGDTRRQIGGSRSMSVNRNAQGVVLPGQNNNNTNNTNVNYKQYVRVGDTLANGYTLTEVERNRVILTRGSDKIELELSDASKNAAKVNRKTNSNRPPNQTQMMQQLLQGMQNMQRAQMMQGFQMMRMNQQAMQNMQQQQQNSGRNGTAPRRR